MNQLTSILAGFALLATTTTAVVAFQGGASEPVKSTAEYFVTGQGDSAHLWVREGTTLRVIAHGKCKECATEAGHEHKEGDKHEHDKPGTKK